MTDQQGAEWLAGADGPFRDERTAPRFTLLIRAAKLIAPQGEFVCVIRDVSETGVSLRGFHRLPVSAPLKLEVQTGERYAIEPMWHREMEAGFRFARSVPIAHIVADDGRFPKRRVRLAIRLRVDLLFDRAAASAQVVNLSQQGARVMCDARLAIDQLVRLQSPVLPDIRARVRWRGDGEYGLVFDDTFSLSQLAMVAAAVQAPDLLGRPDAALARLRHGAAG